MNRLEKREKVVNDKGVGDSPCATDAALRRRPLAVVRNCDGGELRSRRLQMKNLMPDVSRKLEDSAAAYKPGATKSEDLNISKGLDYVALVATTGLKALPD